MRNWSALVGYSSMIWRPSEGADRPMQGQDTILDQPPLLIDLAQMDIEAFEAAVQAGAAAATHFGPPKQSKSRNEDAALAASFTVRGRGYAFACVADGVSTKTFWPERAARLAALAAYRHCRGHVEIGGALSLDAAADFRDGLAKAVRRAFLADRQIVSDVASPPDWSADMFQRHRQTERYWYNTTLVMTLLGPSGGFVFWTGDGGVLIEKTYADKPPVRTSPLESGDSSIVTNIASLVGDITLNGAALNMADGVKSLRILLTTDGVDRTLAHTGDRWAWFRDGGAFDPNPERLRRLLEDLAADPRCELDNLSAAALVWPLRRAGAERQAPRRDASRAGVSSVKQLTVIAERLPRAVAALLLRAAERDLTRALSLADKLETEERAGHWRAVKAEIRLLATDPVQINAEIRLLRKLRDAIDGL